MGNDTRVTLITGASRGIGRACADNLAAAGHHIVNLDHEAPRDDFPGDHYTVDFADRDATRGVLDEVTGRHSITGLLNNVGTTGEQSLEELDLETFDLVMQVNVVTAISCAQACLAAMKAQGFGRIVNVSSELILGIRKRSAYSGTKAMLASLTRTWALELAEHGITVNAIAPGPTNTEFFLNNNPIGSPQREAKLKRIAAGRFGEPEDMANMVGYLMSDKASYVTGQTIFVDGGSGIGNAMLP